MFWASYAKHEQDPKAQSFRVPDEFNDGAEGHPSDTSLIERIYEVTLSRSIYRSTRPGIPHGNPAVRVCATLRGEISPRDSYPHARCGTPFPPFRVTPPRRRCRLFGASLLIAVHS